MVCDVSSIGTMCVLKKIANFGLCCKFFCADDVCGYYLKVRNQFIEIAIMVGMNLANRGFVRLWVCMHRYTHLIF